MISTMPKWIGDWLESATGPHLSVTEVVYITSAVKKIHFQGNVSKMDFIIGGASVIRVSDTEYRNYTVAYHNMEKGIIEIIFHIHGNGVGSQYIDFLKKGDKLYISSPRGRAVYDMKSKQHFIFGDETSLGLACSLLPVLKKNRHMFQFFFELDEENKSAPQLLGLENVVIFPKGAFRNENEIDVLTMFSTSDWYEGHFVLTGNVKSVQALRKVFKSATANKIAAQGYWLEGKKGL